MNYTGQVSLELENKVRKELSPDERILWMEQPIPKFFTGSSIFTFLFGIPWTAFIIFWIFAAYRGIGFKKPDLSRGILPNFFPLFGLPFLVVGIGILTSPLWTYRKALKTLYVITNKRAIVFIDGRTTVINSYFSGQLQNIQRVERKDGTGDIIFGQDLVKSKNVDMDGFLNIRQPRIAEEILKKILEPKSDEYHL
ncbi:MAG: hypothetical protein N3D17_02630 [bacterium]|nr:hypothetical protein [bacterium]